jgi:hypothetical protein
MAALFSRISADPLYHRAFIGETISCIYLPLYFQQNSLYDAVLNRPLGEGHSMVDLDRQSTPYRPDWTPRFLATLCPQCAEVLAGEHDSLVLCCHNCESHWAENDGAFHSVRWQIVRSLQDGESSVYLPFWKIQPIVTGVQLSSFGDFLRLTNQPVVVQKEHDKIPLSFWVPAFKIRPNFFLQLAKSITMAQVRIPGGGTEMTKNMYPVTLSCSEAIQSLKTVLANMTMDKRHFLPQLPSITFQAELTDLIYLPFTPSGHDLVQEQTTVSVSTAVLQFGRSL